MTNPIKIYSVVSKGCIFFDGSTVQPKFLGTILCEVHPTLADRVVVYRTDRQSRTDSAAFRKIFRKLKIDRIQNVLGEYLVGDLGYDRDQVVSYVNNESNKTDVVTSGQSFTVGSSLDFILDETNTSVLFSNGDHHGVNAVRAELKSNGLIGIFPARGDVELYEVEPSIITINSTTPAGDAQSVVNSLNALFTRSATPAPFPIPTFTLADGEAVVPTSVDTGIDTDGMIRNLTDGTKYHGPRLYTTQTLNQPGEYFTFEALNTVAGGGPLLALGLYDAGLGSDDLTEIQATNLSNSGHHGYWWSCWLYNYSGYSAPWTTYGSSSSLNYGPGWNGPLNQQFRYSDAEKGFRSPENAPAKFRVGITDEGFVGVWYYDQENVNLSHGYGDRSNDWILMARSSAPLPSGEYGLLIKLPTDSVQILPGSFERFALEDPAPTLFYRYIESPDGVFHYPLFSSEEEANYVSSDGQSHTHVYPDDSTNTLWYMPGASHGDDTTVYNVDGDGRPVDANGISWTEIVSLTDSMMVPSTFYGLPYSGDEGSTVNFQTQPQDTAYVTTFAGLPAGLVDAGAGMIQGTLPWVSANQSYTVDVIRTNSYGSSTGQLQIDVVDNPSASAISGWTLVQGNTQAPDVVLRDENAVLEFDTQINPGQEVTWSHKHYSTLGFLSAVGESVKATNNIAAETNAWEVQFTPWTSSINHLSYYGVGWDNNSQQYTNGLNGRTWKLVYETGGEIVVYLDDVEMLRSVATYSGPKTLVYAAHESYSVNTLVPSMTVTDTVFVGDPPAGFTQEFGSMDDPTTLANGGVVTLDATLPVGKRMIVNKSWVEANVLGLNPDSLNKAYIGVPAPDANWNSIDLHLDFDAVMRWEGQSSASHKTTLADGSDIVARHESNVGSATDAYYHYAIEWDGTDLTVLADSDLSKFSSAYDKTAFARYSCYENYTEQSGSLPLVIACKGGGGATLTMSGITFIDIPAAPVANLTPWTKALDFSGSSQRAVQVTTSSSWNPLRMRGYATAVGAPADSNKTSGAGTSCPWATAIVYRPDRHSSNQHIWNMGEGTGSNDDNIYLRMDAVGNLYFGWGRDGSLNECTLGQAPSSSGWGAVYIAHNGHRTNNPTAAQLANAFSIRKMGSEWAQPFAALGSELSTTGNWVTTGGRMDRKVEGDFTVGGRGSNRSFHGKVASMVLTTLEQNVDMPDDDEVKMLITDPVKWVQDYRSGQTFRMSGGSASGTWNGVSEFYHGTGVQMWLMGDTSTDSYSNMIRNYVYPSDQNYTKLNMISMQSNDIQNVTITGLSD